LNGKLSKADLTDLSTKINKAQAMPSKDSKPSECSQYMIAVACDLSKLINFIKHQ
jgi:hypothetical protein